MRQLLRFIVVLLALACAFGASTGSAAAAARRVATTGNDTGNCTLTPCRTISYAVGQAASGDAVLVAAGTYTESVTVTKKLALLGSGATIDAAGQTSPPNGVVISGLGASGTLLRGFTIKNAGLEGVFAVKTSNVTVMDNTLLNNDAFGPFHPLCVAEPDDCGEAIHLQSVTNSTVIRNLVQDNVGGILLTDEDGPTSGNSIIENRVLDNIEDCGITLASHWFALGAPVARGVGGVYENKVVRNIASGNGAAGIGIFAGPPGAAAWGNSVVANVSTNNGIPGVAIHGHSPFQNLNDNVIVNNTLSGNGPDDDVPGDDQPTGISIFSAVVPIARTVVAANQISNEHFGIFTVNAVTLSGLPSNHFQGVAVPLSIH
jgi:parallel beta-helix repeat protein